MKTVDELIILLDCELRDIHQLYPYRPSIVYMHDDVLIDILRYLREYRRLTGNVPLDYDLQYKHDTVNDA